MSYKGREECESDIYHVIVRGQGRMLLFEDDNDRRRLFAFIEDQHKECHTKIIAWCFMGNHIHMILLGKLPDISIFMERIEGPYARYFNKKYSHIGHVFQSRFKSVPIDSDAQLLATLHYIHWNPITGGLSNSLEYDWSSYSEYTHAPNLCDTALIRKLFMDMKEFELFHADERSHDVECIKSLERCRLSEAEVSKLVSMVLEEMGLVAFPTGDKSLRDKCLANLKTRGASIRQIERATGIGRNIIARA